MEMISMTQSPLFILFILVALTLAVNKLPDNEEKHMNDEIMTPQHPRWKEFIKRLESPEGINLRIVEGKRLFDCPGNYSKPLARKILKAMGGINIKGTMDYFEEHGGYCDCAILWIVDKEEE